MSSNTYVPGLPKRKLNGNMAANPRLFAHAAFDLIQGSPAALYTDNIPNIEEPARGVCLYAGVAITTLEVVLEGDDAAYPKTTTTFSNIPAGTFLPILVVKVVQAVGVANPGELVALY
jgi:hypothetical protein